MLPYREHRSQYLIPNDVRSGATAMHCPCPEALHQQFTRCACHTLKAHLPAIACHFGAQASTIHRNADDAPSTAKQTNACTRAGASAAAEGVCRRCLHGQYGQHLQLLTCSCRVSVQLYQPAANSLQLVVLLTNPATCMNCCLRQTPALSFSTLCA